MRSRDIGTRAETQVVRYLRDNGFPNAERRALHGSSDMGDITGTPGICWEVKAGDAARTASDGLIRRWLHETTTEKNNAWAVIGVLVVQRWRKPVGKWLAVLRLDDVAVAIGCQFSDPVTDFIAEMPVRSTLADIVALLRAGGWAGPQAKEVAW